MKSKWQKIPVNSYKNFMLRLSFQKYIPHLIYNNNQEALHENSIYAYTGTSKLEEYYKVMVIDISKIDTSDIFITNYNETVNMLYKFIIPLLNDYEIEEIDNGTKFNKLCVMLLLLYGKVDNTVYIKFRNIIFEIIKHYY